MRRYYTMMVRDIRSAKQRLGDCLVPLLLAVVFTTCDFSVTNPGPVQDEFLDDPEAFLPIVLGARRNLGDAMGHNIVYWGAVVSFEVNPSGATGYFGVPSKVQAGDIDDQLSEDWENAQRARWTSEDAVRRFGEVLDQADFSSSALVAEAYLWAGYANRLMGENFCQATTDGGPVEQHTAFYERAEGHFRNAIQIGTAAGESWIVTAAQAGLASVLADLATYDLADWSEAAAEAAKIADNNFVFQMPYAAGDESQYNVMAWTNYTEPWRTNTVWATYYEDYYRTTGDPRTPWVDDPRFEYGDAPVLKFGGLVTWYRQDKHVEKDDPINLSSGWEMRLIEAEAALAQNDLPAALAKMNIRRTDLGLAQITAADITAGWAALKFERAVELWLEGRRLGDLRRWRDNNVPGETHDGVYMDTDDDGVYERVEDMDSPIQHSYCYPIGLSERESNPNVPLECGPECQGR
jgi:hypothetical protein